MSSLSDLTDRLRQSSSDGQSIDDAIQAILVSTDKLRPILEALSPAAFAYLRLAPSWAAYRSDLHTGGSWRHTGHDGFRSEFQDPWLGSRDQVGHFLTAVNHALNGAGHAAAASTGATAGSVEDALLLDLGHEFIADPTLNPFRDSPWIYPGFSDQFHAADSTDVTEFRAALANMQDDPDATVDLQRLRTDLNSIIVRRAVPILPVRRDREPEYPPPERYGNSVQDLMLTAMGWHFAAMIRAGAFVDAEQAASWLDANLGAATASGD